MSTFQIEDLVFNFKTHPQHVGYCIVTAGNPTHTPAKAIYSSPGALGYKIIINSATADNRLRSPYVIMIKDWKTFSLCIPTNWVTFILKVTTSTPKLEDLFTLLAAKYAIISPVKEDILAKYPEMHDTSVYITNCKESCTNQLSIDPTPYGTREVFIIEPFVKKETQWVRSLQANISEEDRMVIRRRDTYTRVYFPNWWVENNQAQYRIGWALLALRAANGNQPIAPKSMLEKKFIDFQNGKFSVKDPTCWYGNRNWRHNAENNTLAFE